MKHFNAIVAHNRHVLEVDLWCEWNYLWVNHVYWKGDFDYVVAPDWQYYTYIELFNLMAQKSKPYLFLLICRQYVDVIFYCDQVRNVFLLEVWTGWLELDLNIGLHFG